MGLALLLDRKQWGGASAVRKKVSFARSIFSSWQNVYLGSTRTDGQRTALDVIALKRGIIQTDQRTIDLQFDRLTAEDSALTFRDATSPDGRQTGDIRYLSLGLANGGRGGELNLRNASIEFANDTRLLMAAPDSRAAVVHAQSGENQLSLGNQSSFAERALVKVDDGAALTFSGTALGTRIEGAVQVGTGSELTLANNSVVNMLQNDGSSLPRSSINGGNVTIDGELSKLRLTAPVFSDSITTLNNGATLQIQQRNNARSTLSFSGNNTLHFGDAEAAVIGSDAERDQLTLEVGAGTTTIISSGAVSNTNRGLQIDQVNIDGGTLNTIDFIASTEQADNWKELTVKNGGSLYDRYARYRDLDRLLVDSATLRTRSEFGTFAGSDGIDTAKFTNSTIDLALASPNGTTSGSSESGLQTVTINAQHLNFSGTNQVHFGINPAGECFSVAGSCVPGTTRYTGQLVTNVGNTSGASLTGFDTVVFIPKAMDPNAVSADYITGGNGGVYTVAQANNSSDLTSNTQDFDAPPMTPTATQLSAARSDLPANLVYTIVNNPVADDRVDISFVNIGLLNHPLVSTGTTNTKNYGKLVVKSNRNLTHADLQNVETLHPEAYASNMTVALEQSDQIRNMVLGNAMGTASGGNRNEGFTDDGRRFWMDSALMEGSVDRNNDLAGFAYNLGQVVFGADLWLSEPVNIGAFVGYGQYSMDGHWSSTNSLVFSSKAYHVGAYGSYDVPNWSLKGMAGYSWAKTKAAREAVTGAGSNIHDADYDSGTLQVAVRAEYTNFPTIWSWSVSPEVGLGYARYEQGSFTESGPNSSAFTIQNAVAESLIGSIGLNLTGPAFGGGLEQLAFVRYEHDFIAKRDSVHEINAGFAPSPGISQSFVGTHRGSDSVSIGLGLRSAPGGSANVSAGIVYTKNSYGDEIGGGLRISWEF